MPLGCNHLLLRYRHRNATLYEKLNFDFTRDIVPVASITRAPHMLVVHPLFPAKTVPDAARPL
jgi:tripartite-type tricarboxylate transporter receptor subunit TctC